MLVLKQTFFLSNTDNQDKRIISIFVTLSYEEFVVGERYSVCKRKSKMKKIFETDDTFCSEGVDIIHFRDTIVSIIVHFDNDNVFKKYINDIQVKYGVK